MDYTLAVIEVDPNGIGGFSARLLERNAVNPQNYSLRLYSDKPVTEAWWQHDITAFQPDAQFVDSATFDAEVTARQMVSQQLEPLHIRLMQSPTRTLSCIVEGVTYTLQYWDSRYYFEPMSDVVMGFNLYSVYAQALRLGVDIRTISHWSDA